MCNPETAAAGPDMSKREFMSTGGISWCRACVGLTGPRNIYFGRFGSGGGARRVMGNEREGNLVSQLLLLASNILSRVFPAS